MKMAFKSVPLQDYSRNALSENKGSFFTCSRMKGLKMWVSADFKWWFSCMRPSLCDILNTLAED